MIKVKVSISRRSNDKIYINVVDEASGIQFLDSAFEPYDFAQMITGLARVEGIAEVRGLEHVGKTKISERRSTVCLIGGYDRKELTAWLAENCQEEGWILDTYLGSHSSIGRNAAGETILNYSVYKYVEPEL